MKLIRMLVGLNKQRNNGKMSIIFTSSRRSLSVVHPARSATAIYVYDGLGSDAREKGELLKSLWRAANPDKYSVNFITPTNIIDGGWVNTAALLAIGGGYDKGFMDALGEPGFKVIRDYVNGGGSYLGLGAGGYFACDRIEFDKGGPLEVVGDRPLKFFQGKCIGPTFPGFEYETLQGASAPPIDVWDSQQRKEIKFHAYFNGGGSFVPYGGGSFVNSDQAEVLAKYSSLPDQPAAIIKTRVGSGGRAVLTGVQVECSSDGFNKDDPYVQQWIGDLEKSEADRKRCFTSILEDLGVSCR